MKRRVTLGQMLFVLTAGMILSFIIFGPECDNVNAAAPVCGETICVPLND